MNRFVCVHERTNIIIRQMLKSLKRKIIKSSLNIKLCEWYNRRAVILRVSHG